MHNLSVGGFAAWSKTELQRHDTLYVREFASEGERPRLEDVVRHCTRGIRGFLIGAEFMEQLMTAKHDDSPQQQDACDADLPNRNTANLMGDIGRYREKGFRLS